MLGCAEIPAPLARRASTVTECGGRRASPSSITRTLDRYGHLFPSVEEALADALDATFNGAKAPAPLSHSGS